MPGASIYILRCADGGYYTGITRRDVDERVSEHAQGLVEGCYTVTRRPVVLAFREHYERIDEAIAAERRIKGWSRAKKEAYMRGDFELLSVLARRRSKKRVERGSSPPHPEPVEGRDVSSPPHPEPVEGRDVSSPFETGPSDPPQGEDPLG
jgi:putative endonuclease